MEGLFAFSSPKLFNLTISCSDFSVPSCIICLQTNPFSWIVCKSSVEGIRCTVLLNLFGICYCSLEPLKWFTTSFGVYLNISMCLDLSLFVSWSLMEARWLIVRLNATKCSSFIFQVVQIMFWCDYMLIILKLQIISGRKIASSSLCLRFYEQKKQTN